MLKLFNEYVKELHKEARSCFLAWRSFEKSRAGSCYTNMCQQTYFTCCHRPNSRVVIGREVDYRSRLIYVRYCLTNTTLCL